MSCISLVFWDEHATGYDFGPDHPMRPLRLELTMALARGLSLFDAPGVRVAATGRRNRSMRQRASPRP